MAFFVYGVTNNSMAGVNVASGDTVIVDPNVTLGVETYTANFTSGPATFQVLGAIVGYDDINIVTTGASGFTSVNVASTGSLLATGPAAGHASDSYAAITIDRGGYRIDNAGSISMSGEAGAILSAIKLAGGDSAGGTIVNSGTISSGDDCIYDINNLAADDYVTNDGVIEGGDDAIHDVGSHVDIIVNHGTIDSRAWAIDGGSSTQEVVTNTGQIYGDVGSSAQYSSTVNTGTIAGGVSLGGAEDLFDNSGLITGSIYLGPQGGFKNSGAIAGSVTLSIGDTFTDSGTIEGSILDVGGAASNVAHDLSISATGKVTATAGTALELSEGNYTLENAGSISAARVAAQSISGVSLTGSGSFVNSGTVAGVTSGVVSQGGAGKSQYLYNSGTISGAIGVNDTGGHTARVVNYGQIVSTTQSTAVLADISTSERFVNEGGVTGDIDLNGPTSTVVNGGSIHGSVNFGLGSGRFVNTGSVDGAIAFTGTGNVYLGKGGSFTGTLTGTGSDGRYYAGAGVEKFDLTTDGAATAVGGTGETTFDYGAKFTNSMTVQGGSGTTIVDLEGNYTGVAGVSNSGAIFLGARTMVGVDKVVFGAGAFSYSLSVSASTVANGATMTVDASAVGAGQTATLNISKDVGGFYDFIGGAGLNTIICAASNLFANDVFIGGSNASNAINFKTAGTVLSAAFANISGFSVINLVSGTNDIQLNDFMVTKANNHTVAVNLSTGADIIDSSLLITSSNNVVVNAQNASAGDTFIFGAAKETVTLGAGVSTSVNYDTVSNFNFGSGSVFDALTVTGYTPLGIDAAVSGSLSTASFDADLATALAGHLHSGDALLFTANAGTLAGDTFLIASTNSSAGYAAGDFVARLTGTTTGTLAVGNV